MPRKRFIFSPPSRRRVCRETAGPWAAAEGDGQARATVVEHALAYGDLLEAHIQKEDGILFNMADKVLSAEENERLEEAYRTAIPTGADAGTGTRYEESARTLCERWQIDPDERRSLQGGFGCHHQE